jgi:hypothetical protein
MSELRTDRSWNGASAIKAAVLVGLAVLLVYQLAWRSKADGTTRGSEHLTTSTEIRPGELLADVELVDLREGADSSKVSLSRIVGDGCHYLMIYAAECPWCTKVAPTWSTASRVRFDDAAYPMSWISVGPDNAAARGYMAEHDLRFPVFAVASAEASRRLRWVKVPSLWLVRADTVISTVEATRREDLQPPRPGDCEQIVPPPESSGG